MVQFTAFVKNVLSDKKIAPLSNITATKTKATTPKTVRKTPTTKRSTRTSRQSSSSSPPLSRDQAVWMQAFRYSCR